MPEKLNPTPKGERPDISLIADSHVGLRSAAMVGHISPDLNPAVLPASGSAQLLEWCSWSLGLTDCSDLSDTVFG
jgi:hypothetical protein